MKNQAYSNTIFHYNSDFNILKSESHLKNVMFNGFIEANEYHDPAAFLKEIAENDFYLGGMKIWYEHLREEMTGDASLRSKNTFVDRPITVKLKDGTGRVMYPRNHRTNMQNISSQIDIPISFGDKVFLPFAMKEGEKLMAKDIEEIIISPSNTEFGKLMLFWCRDEQK